MKKQRWAVRPRMLEGMVVAKGLKCWEKLDYLAMDEQKVEHHIF